MQIRRAFLRMYVQFCPGRAQSHFPPSPPFGTERPSKGLPVAGKKGGLPVSPEFDEKKMRKLDGRQRDEKFCKNTGGFGF